jgi:hypothetical protein
MVPSSVVSTIKDAIADNIPLVFGSDGGLNEQGGTFGYVMGLTEVPLWEGAGPVDGDPHTASSTRSELFGYAGSLELLLLLKKVYQLFDTGATVITWMDSSSAMTRLDDLEQSTPNSGQYPDDADILTHIQWLWNELPGITHTRQSPSRLRFPICRPSVERSIKCDGRFPCNSVLPKRYYKE